MNFDPDYSTPQNIGAILLIQATNFIASEINPILGTVSILGSILYISLKIKKEFYDKDKS